LLTSELSKVKNNIITLGKLYIDHDSPKNFAKCKESAELIEKLLKTYEHKTVVLYCTVYYV
jgi:hypothetical protein